MPTRSGFFRKHIDINNLIEKRRWNKLLQRLNSTSNPSDLLLSLPDRGLGQNALHLLCSKVPPIEVVKKFIEISPVLAIEIDHQERTPLHIASASLAPTDVIQLLTSAYPETVSAKDNYGKTALMLACESFLALGPSSFSLLNESDSVVKENNFSSTGRIKALILASPRNVTDEDNSGRSALEYAISNDAPKHIVRILQHACKIEIERQRAEERSLEGNRDLNKMKMRGFVSSPTYSRELVSDALPTCKIPSVINATQNSPLARMSSISCL